MSNYIEYRRKLKGAHSPEQIVADKPQTKSLNQKKPAPRSKKLTKDMQKYIPEMKQFLLDNQVCQINMKGCTVTATCVHHTAGRTGPQLRNQNDWKPSCHNCNGKVETDTKQAIERGHKKQRNGKPIRK